MFDSINAENAKVFLESAISIFAIVNPVGNLPIFVGLTEDASPNERRRVLRLASLIAFLIICGMAVAGGFLINNVFHITFDEFRFGGGLILVALGIRHILSQPRQPSSALGSLSSKDAQARESDQIRLAVTPIASPLLVGPGSIVTVMLLVNKFGTAHALAAALASFLAVAIILNYAHLFYRLLGKVGALAIGRVMNIFIVAIGAHFIFVSIREAFMK